MLRVRTSQEILPDDTICQKSPKGGVQQCHQLTTREYKRSVPGTRFRGNSSTAARVKELCLSRGRQLCPPSTVEVRLTPDAATLDGVKWGDRLFRRVGAFLDPQWSTTPFRSAIRSLESVLSVANKRRISDASQAPRVDGGSRTLYGSESRGNVG